MGERVVIGGVEYNIVRLQPFGKAVPRTVVYFKGRKGMAASMPWEDDKTKRQASVVRRVAERKIPIPEAAKVDKKERFYHSVATFDYKTVDNVHVEYRVEIFSGKPVDEELLDSKLNELFDLYPTNLKAIMDQHVDRQVNKEVEQDEVGNLNRWQYYVEFRERGFKKTGFL